jgi:hypothetical protein
VAAILEGIADEGAETPGLKKVARPDRPFRALVSREQVQPGHIEVLRREAL